MLNEKYLPAKLTKQRGQKIKTSIYLFLSLLSFLLKFCPSKIFSVAPDCGPLYFLPASRYWRCGMHTLLNGGTVKPSFGMRPRCQVLFSGHIANKSKDQLFSS